MSRARNRSADRVHDSHQCRANTAARSWCRGGARGRGQPPRTFSMHPLCISGRNGIHNPTQCSCAINNVALDSASHREWMISRCTAISVAPLPPDLPGRRITLSDYTSRTRPLVQSSCNAVVTAPGQRNPQHSNTFECSCGPIPSLRPLLPTDCHCVSAAVARTVAGSVVSMP